MKVGVFFGGQSREREVSFAGGRTVYDNLNKELFEPVPIFIDSVGNFILLNWQHLYKGTIRDFYPAASDLPETIYPVQLYVESIAGPRQQVDLEVMEKVGRPVQPHQFRDFMDIAFLALHGPYGEDGNIQGLLEWYGIPYTGAGIFPSALGIDKILQDRMFSNLGLPRPASKVLTWESWFQGDRHLIFRQLKEALGLPLVVKAPHQGSSMGVHVLKNDDFDTFNNAVNHSFFVVEVSLEWWKKLDPEERTFFLRKETDLRSGLGFPMVCDGTWLYSPDQLAEFLDQAHARGVQHVRLEYGDREPAILVEAFLDGKEFSCIVIEDEKGKALALPPTEIRKRQTVFDYRAKYLPGVSRKITPIDLPDEVLQEIRNRCVRLYQAMQCSVYARIDGFYTTTGEIFLNDPNTTSGMMPSSFFFHQAAEIGLNPSQFLTYILRTSLNRRLDAGKQQYKIEQLLSQLDHALEKTQQESKEKIQVAVIMGGYSTERHISVESGRNIYEKLASSSKYHPIPVFLTGSDQHHELYRIPVNIMLKDNADDIRDYVKKNSETSHQQVMRDIRQQARSLTQKYCDDPLFYPEPLTYEQLAGKVTVAFIALHGRPGEDGAVQRELEKVGVAYNGSGVESSQMTINKYETNKFLAKQGISVARHRLVTLEEWQQDRSTLLDELKENFSFPLIAKPADDGCSSAVKKIKNLEELEAFAEGMFRQEADIPMQTMSTLGLQPGEEFPAKTFFLIEELITARGAHHFLEITGGMLTRYDSDGALQIQVFEPSETLATGDVLSLEEKFLAGEGQNITPARFDPDPEINANISQKVKADLEQVARLLGIEGYARIDAFVRIFSPDRVETVVIEVNSLPGMTPATCIFHQTALASLKPYDFIDAILEFGIRRFQSRNNVTA